ncbi:hypothetical protein [Paenibacillus arenilitoris]|uniref:hypothetical protein n=1 Tax=Paenibacillus arenilitoris TaxID=2772299 RepID=UPI001CC26506|nr:hypothetical protein [Paenibacillus arenilitoris]
MDTALLERGLAVISRCKERTGDIWEAHIGAAGIAAYFLVKENGFGGELAARIVAQAGNMLDAYAAPPPAGAVPDTSPADAERLILEALERTIDGLHWVGHNVIYSAVSLMALRELGNTRSRAEIDGIARLILSFEKTIPGRSWIGYTASQVKRFTIEESDHFPDIRNAARLSAFILDEVAAFPVIYRAEAHHDLIGHMLTSSHALNILSDLGHEAYFRRGLPPLMKLVKALRAARQVDLEQPPPLHSPVDRLPLVQASRSGCLPHETAYWTADYAGHDWDYGHVFKFPFSFYNHLNRLPGPARGGDRKFPLRRRQPFLV